MLPRGVRLLARVAGALVLSVLLTAGAAAALFGIAPADAALAAAVTIPVALFLGWWLVHPLRDTVVAVSHGLWSFRERDYGPRVAVSRDDELGDLVQRFNDLGKSLKSERNTAYQRELLLATVIESAPAAIVIHDEAQVVVLANGVARDLFFEGKRLEGQAFDRLLEEGPLRVVIAAHEDGLCTCELSGEVQTYHVSRSEFELNTQRHTLLIVKPLTREILRQEIDVWKKTIRVIAHELNNSLAPISSLTHSARAILARPEHTHRLGSIFSTIEERTEHLTRFVEGYARYARLPPPAVERVEWRGFLERLRPLYPFAMPAEIPPEPAWFDPAQLEQVLINVLKNAVESGSPPESIELRIASGGGEVTIEVLDRGPGIPRDVLPKALLPFFTTKATGSGLGLPLSREIVEAHGGRLSVERREGGGTVVRCVLPERSDQ